MKSLSLAALLVGLIGEFSYRAGGTPDFGDASVPVQYVFRGGNTLDNESGGSASYGGSGYKAASGGFLSENTGRPDGGENYGGSDADQYGGSKRYTRRRVILVLIRKRPWLQDGSGSEEDGERWGRRGEEYASDDQSIRQRRRAQRALLSTLLRKMLLAAVRRSSVGEGNEEGQGGDFGAEQQWGRSEPRWRSGRRFGEGSDYGSADTFDGRGGRWGQGGFSVVGGPLLVRLGRLTSGDSSGFYGSGDDQGPQNGPMWISSATLRGAQSGIPSRIGEGGGGHSSDAANGGTGYEIFSHLRNLGARGEGSPLNEIPDSGTGGLTDSRGFGSSSESFSAQPSTWQRTGGNFVQYPNIFVRGNEGSSPGGISGDLQSGDQGSYYHASLTPNPADMRGPINYARSDQADSASASFGSRFGETPVNTFNFGSNTGYNRVFGGLPGENPVDSSGINEAYDSNNPALGSAASVNMQWPQKSS